MRHINILWPEKLANEYLRLCDAFYDTITDVEAENDAVCFAKKDAYISSNASKALMEWLKHVDGERNESA